MTTDIAKKEQQIDMKAQISYGRQALSNLRTLVKNRPNPVIINGKRYLEYCDWQILGSFFGITAYVEWSKEITEDVPILDGKLTAKKVIGFVARAKAIKDYEPISAAEAECMFDEPNWAKKPRFQLRSMAETRACAKALRNVLQWVVKLPEDNGTKPQEQFADESAEEMQGSFE